MHPKPETVRLDRWLCAARFSKTRSRAAAAIDGGKIRLNGVRAKRSKGVAVGDTIRISQPPYQWTVVVKGLADRRRSAAEARALYQETEESAAARERLRARLRHESEVVRHGRGRPTKKERRRIDRMKRRRR